MSGDKIIRRPTARIIVLCPDDRLLLFRAMIGHSIEPERRPDATSFWALPGGGIEAGESAECAARRELKEETGLDADAPLPLVAKRSTRYDWKGRRFHTDEHIFFHRAATNAIDASGWLEGDRRWMADLGWWTLAGLAATNDIVRPPGLLPLARSLARGQLPDVPIMLERHR